MKNFNYTQEKQNDIIKDFYFLSYHIKIKEEEQDKLYKK